MDLNLVFFVYVKLYSHVKIFAIFILIQFVPGLLVEYLY